MDNQVDLFQLRGQGYAQKNRHLHARRPVLPGQLQRRQGHGAVLLRRPDLPAVQPANPTPRRSPSAPRAPTAWRPPARRWPTRWRDIGELAVDSAKRLYLEDTVSPERQVTDRALGVLLSRVVLRFDRHGKLEDFIGQEGVGGTPFPYIESLYVTGRDELVVVSRTPRTWLVYWYSSAGSLQHQLTMDPAGLPALAEAPAATPSLGKLVPDLERRTPLRGAVLLRPQAAGRRPLPGLPDPHLPHRRGERALRRAPRRARGRGPPGGRGRPGGGAAAPLLRAAGGQHPGRVLPPAPRGHQPVPAAGPGPQPAARWRGATWSWRTPSCTSRS